MEKEQIKAILESLLFASGDPLPQGRLIELVGEDKKSVRAALEELQADYEQNPARGLRLAEAAGGWQLQTSPDNAPWVGKLLQSKPVRLSKPSLETLSIIAYRQPVTRSEIEAIRGVDSGQVIKTLLEYDFIQIQGRKDVPGKPLIYGSSKRFLEFFRLKSLADLPSLKELEELQEEVLEGQQVETVGEDGPTLFEDREPPTGRETPPEEGGDEANEADEPGDDSEAAATADDGETASGGEGSADDEDDDPDDDEEDDLDDEDDWEDDEDEDDDDEDEDDD